MAKKLAYVALTWGMIILVYIILAVLQTPIQTITAGASSNLTATSNMSNYPGALEVVDMFPLIVWFIPGLVGIVATAVFLKQND